MEKAEASLPNLITRAEAKASGLKRYFTGKPCKSGHVVERDTACGRCCECSKGYCSTWSAKNPDKAKAKDNAWRAANPERVKQMKRNARARDPEKARQGLRDHRSRNVEKYRLQDRARYRANPEPYKHAAKNRRARQRGAAGVITEAIVVELYGLQKGKCAYCRIALRKRFAVDHIQALINGGTNERQNLQLLCRPCNGKKGRSDPIVYARRIGLLI